MGGIRILFFQTTLTTVNNMNNFLCVSHLVNWCKAWAVMNGVRQYIHGFNIKNSNGINSDIIPKEKAKRLITSHLAFQKVTPVGLEPTTH